MPFMRDEVLQTLRRVNESFYQTFAVQFSSTRERLQPGVLRAVESIPFDAAILDLGCGNGELARHLLHHSHQGTYLGLDLSETLLEQARTRVAEPQARFLHADLTDSSWAQTLQKALPDPSKAFGQVFAFAVLHHIPGSEIRRTLVQTVRDLIKPGGRWIVSVWDFLASDRLRTRILPWERAGLKDAEVEPGDYLLDWRRGGVGQRYVHHFTPVTLTELAEAGGFSVENTYRSDGENGQLGLYQVWRPA